MHAISEDTMNDRELLELAAKAAGHAIDRIDAMHDPEDWACWNPLEDDGDALRLAVPPGHAFARLRSVPRAQAAKERFVGLTRAHYPEYDLYAATRRAIVRAAAVIAQQDQPK